MKNAPFHYTWFYKYPISKIFGLPFNRAFYKLVSCLCCNKFPQTLSLKNIYSLTVLVVRTSTSVLLDQQNHTPLEGPRLRIGYLPLPAFGGYQHSLDIGYSTPGTFTVETLSPPLLCEFSLCLPVIRALMITLGSLR